MMNMYPLRIKKDKFLIYYLLFILIPFSQSIPVFTLAGRLVNVGMHTLVILVIVSISFLFGHKRLRLLKEPATIVLLLLVGWCFLTVFASMRFAPVSALANSLVTLLRWCQFVPIFILIVYGQGNIVNFRKIVQIFICIGFIVAIWGIYQTIFPSEFAIKYFRGAVTFTKPLFREKELYQIIDPVTGYYIGSANYNIAGAFSSIIALFSIPFLFKGYYGNTEKKQLALPIAFFMLLVTGVIVTQSRSAFLCFIVGLLFVCFKPSVSRVCAIVVSAFFAIVVFIVFISETGFGVRLIETVTYLPKAIPIVLQGQEYSHDMEFSINVFGAAKRILTVMEALYVFVEFPFLGCGFFGFSFYSPQFGTAECFYAQILAETGIIGFGLLFIFLFTVWKYTRTRYPIGTFAYKYQVGFRGAFVAALVANLTGTLFYDQRIWGLFLVLSAIQIRLAREEGQNVKSMKEIVDENCVSAY
jgi:hypothetical protein